MVPLLPNGVIFLKKWWQRVHSSVMGGTTALTVVKALTITVAVGVILAGIVVLVEFASSPHGRVFSEQSVATSVLSANLDIEVIVFCRLLFFGTANSVRHCVKETPRKSIPVFPVLVFSDMSIINRSEVPTLRDFIWRLQNNFPYGVSTMDAPHADSVLGKGGSSCVSDR